MVRYAIEGDIDAIAIPARQAPGVADDLWRHTCCEAFVAGNDAPGYVEFNFSPSGKWAVYRFTRQRERASPATAADAFDPHITVCRGETKLELDAVIRLDRLWPRRAGVTLRMGLSAVIEDRHGTLSYWALKHPLDKPDFHHPDSFALELDEARH